MSIQLKIMLSGAVLLGGFLWSYLFLRQIFFNYLVAYPLIKKMNALQPDLIAIGAKRYTTVSVVTCLILASVILFLIIYFCPLYVIISFAVGAIAALCFFVFRMKPSNKSMFELFINTYYRFVPDDELRTVLYNKDYKKIRPRLRAMGIYETFVPEFEKQ